MKIDHPLMRRMLIIFILLFGTALGGTGDAEHPVFIFLFISDGCGFEHIRATDYYELGASDKQIYHTFPVQYSMSTYPADGIPYDPVKAWLDFEWVKVKPTDSAAAATALATGLKTLNSRISMNQKGERLETVTALFESRGVSSGVVTSVPFMHATPAAFGAHNRDRHNYEEIAREMIGRSPLHVIMGCGHPDYNDMGEKIRPEKRSYHRVGGDSLWSRVIAGKAGNDYNGDGHEEFWTFSDDRSIVQSWMSGETPERVIVVPRVGSTLQEKRGGDRSADPYVVPFMSDVPTLNEMCRAAINVLDEDPEGFFLMVEGGAVDWASHDNFLGRMIEEQIDFNRCVKTAVEWIDENDAWDRSLIMVTADHETGYLSGPGSGNAVKGKRGTKRGEWKPIVNQGKGRLPLAEWHSGSHTASLVPFYARGMGAKLFRKYINGFDPKRGPYIDQTAISRILFSMFHGNRDN